MNPVPISARLLLAAVLALSASCATAPYEGSIDWNLNPLPASERVAPGVRVLHGR
jgi:hypothetical protein